MLKILRVFLFSPVVAISLFAGDINHELLTSYLKQSISKEVAKQPNKKALIKNIRFLTSKKIDKTWTGYFISMKVTVFDNGESGAEVIPAQVILFTDGKSVTEELAGPLGQDITASLIPTVDESMYAADHIIAGNKSAKHKIVVFSDPVCPGCRKALPRILTRVRNNPNEFVLYFYHFPLEHIHPEAVGIVKGMIALHRIGKRDVIDRVYTEDIQSFSDLKKMYGDIKISEKDVQHYKNDLDVTERLAVAGTPALYYDGVNDPHGKRFFSWAVGRSALE